MATITRFGLEANAWRVYTREMRWCGVVERVAGQFKATRLYPTEVVETFPSLLAAARWILQAPILRSWS